MSSTDSSWLSFWDWFASIGFILVIIGCVIEGVEHFVKFKRTEAQRRKGIEKLGWLILVGGLAMEFLGDNRAKRISNRENKRLANEAAQAHRDSSKAIERSSSNDLQVAVFSKKLIELAHLYDLSTNALSEANSRLASIKPLRERIIDLLEEIDPRIVPMLRVSPEFIVRGNLRQDRLSELERFAREPGASQYISDIKPKVGFSLMTDGYAHSEVDFKVHSALIATNNAPIK